MMTTIGLAVLVLLALAILALLGILLKRSASGATERAVRNELRRSRDEATGLARALRDDLARGVKSSTDTLMRAVGELSALQKGQLATQLAVLGQDTQERLDGVRSAVESQVAEIRDSDDARFREVRTTLESSLRTTAEDASKSAQALREEITRSLASFQAAVDSRHDAVRQTVDQRLQTTQDQTAKAAAESLKVAQALRGEVTQRLSTFQQSVETRYDAMRQTVDQKLQATQDQTARASEESTRVAQSLCGEVTERLSTFQQSVETRYDGMRQTVDQKLQAVQDHTTKASRELREELSTTLRGNADSVGQQLRSLGETVQLRLDAVRGTVESQLRDIQENNSKKLDEIRQTVDEQLQTTLERRLSESFNVVSGHLEAVQRGLGEMQALATGLGDLKRVLTNVRVRGTWAEFQLGAILEEILTPDQYARNVQTRHDSAERVEFAVRLPGRNGDSDSCVWLPIDSRFPTEPYERLRDAAEAADFGAVQVAVADLEGMMRVRAREICEAYLSPPNTTDFGILFLPTEGLYAEVLRVPNLAADLQRRFRVIVAGPTNLAALLSSLRMGFQTLAIERRASEVWKVLRAVKTEFGKFDAVLMKLRRQLDRAARTIDATDVTTRAMERHLREVEELPTGLARDILRLPEAVEALDWEALLKDDSEPEGV